MRFLIDECLSIDLVPIATQAGHQAQHVAHVGKAGWKDWNVARYAAEGDDVLVTNNAGDFRRRYAAQLLHAGLVIIIPNVDRRGQRPLFQGALDALARFGEPVNRVLEVDIEGDDVVFRLYDLPAKSALTPVRRTTIHGLPLQRRFPGFVPGSLLPCGPAGSGWGREYPCRMVLLRSRGAPGGLA
jgi:predicted nuclease of predicted toxin-antitoxin system